MRRADLAGVPAAPGTPVAAPKPAPAVAAKSGAFKALAATAQTMKRG